MTKRKRFLVVGFVPLRSYVPSRRYLAPWPTDVDAVKPDIVAKRRPEGSVVSWVEATVTENGCGKEMRDGTMSTYPKI
jgi:hypothetical protein